MPQFHEILLVNSLFVLFIFLAIFSLVLGLFMSGVISPFGDSSSCQSSKMHVKCSEVTILEGDVSFQLSGNGEVFFTQITDGCQFHQQRYTAPTIVSFTCDSDYDQYVMYGDYTNAIETIPSEIHFIIES